MEYEKLISDYELTRLNSSDRYMIEQTYHSAQNFMENPRNHGDFNKIARVENVIRTLEGLL